METLDQPRAELSPYAPRILTFTIHPDKIRDVIGSGGKTINKIIADTGVKIDIEDDGTVYIASPDAAAAAEAKRIIDGIVKDIEVGDVYLGTVVSIQKFGAFVNLTRARTACCTSRALANKRVEKVGGRGAAGRPDPRARHRHRQAGQDQPDPQGSAE